MDSAIADERILCVDDDANLLESYQRQLRKRFHVETALSGEEGLAAIQRGKDYAVVVSDMRMPHMNGVEFLSKVREIAPRTVRIMLTGYADTQTVRDAVNDGQVFRLLTKPCPRETLATVLEAALDEHRAAAAQAAGEPKPSN